MLKINHPKLIESCCKWLQAQHPRTLVHGDELANAISDYYIMVRDMKVSLVSEWLFRRFGFKLSDWLGDIMQNLAEVDEPYYLQFSTTDLDEAQPEERARCAAAAMAVLLFYRAMGRGWIRYSFEMTEDEAAAWLDQYAPKKVVQASLFAGVL